MIIKGRKFRLGLMVMLAIASLGSDCVFQINGSEVVKNPNKNLEEQQKCMAECSKKYCDKSGNCYGNDMLNQCNRQCADAYPT